MISILLVEDDKHSCNEFINTIEEYDMTLVGVTNHANKAIEYIKDYLPDVIILDLELHNGTGSGFSVLVEIKQLGLATLPYILITTNNSSQLTYDSVRRLGGDYILAKYQNDYSAKNVLDFINIMKPTIMSRKKSHNTFFNDTTPALQTKRIVNRINTMLNQIGISPKSIGYQYLVKAISVIIEKPTPNVCSVVGKSFKKTESSVERAMQNAINKAWRTTDIDDLLYHYTARINSEKGVPTLTEFIYYFANKITNEYIEK
ncbi:MAG TPA: sporulation initiation factor Spo0A C-terminal domain-containing protein [Sedimentibacter sp.]|nr:sporulation initiation factor Spo0A C-terminal domain-containing protein [Sedimentibacter sp.]